MVDSEWQRRRGALNHDWLKGRYIPDLDRWLHVLDGLVENEAFAQDFLELIFPQWEALGREAVALARDFEQQMSPRILLDQSPLSRRPIEIRRWLGELVHDLWLNRYPIRSWAAKVAASVTEADVSYRGLRNHDPKPSCPQTARSLRPLYHKFREDCYAVATAIGCFPHDVRAT